MIFRCPSGRRTVAAADNPFELLLEHKHRQYNMRFLAGTVTIVCDCCQGSIALTLNENGWPYKIPNAVLA